MKPTLLGFGAMRLPSSLSECTKMFAAYMESGGNYFDTAYVYGGSEEKLQKALVSKYPRDKFLISTKLPPWSVSNTKDCDRHLTESMRRLGVDYLDYYLMHSIGADTDKKLTGMGAYEWAQEQKKKGTMRQVGFSFHDTPEALENILSAHPEMDFVMLQLNYCDIMRGTADKFHKAALKHNKPILVMEPIKGGTLANLPKAAEALLKAQKPQYSIASWAMRYAASLEGVISVPSGMSTLAQVEDNIKTFKNFEPMQEDEYASLEQVMEILGKESNIPCTGCNYCLPVCPQNIEISTCLTLYNEFKRAGEKFNRHIMYKAIPTNKKASACTSCNACLPRCPQNINIPKELATVHEELKTSN